MHVHHSDAVDESSLRELIGWTADTFGPLDVAILNVGALVEGAPVDMSIEDMGLNVWTRSIHQNLTSCSPGMMCQIECMRPRGEVVIATTASMAGLRISRTTPSCIASKAGVIHLTGCAAVAYGTSGIRVNAVDPGMIAPPATPGAIPDPEVQHAIRRPART